jgi:hypothetical protein
MTKVRLSVRELALVAPKLFDLFAA